MKLYKITNFVIVLLVITAIYQTGELWLQGTSGHNFFYSFNIHKRLMFLDFHTITLQYILRNIIIFYDLVSILFKH